jgi:hypothetical protein
VLSSLPLRNTFKIFRNDCRFLTWMRRWPDHGIKILLRTPKKFSLDSWQWPDDKLFGDLVTALITRARANSRRVQAFGEMVAPLWARDDQAATIRLEYPWHQICKSQAFPLFYVLCVSKDRI